MISFLSKQAQTSAIAIVLLAVAVLGGAAVYLTSNAGNQVSGAITASNFQQGVCNQLIDSGGPAEIVLTENLDCPGASGITIITDQVSLDCQGHTISGDGTRVGVYIYVAGDHPNAVLTGNNIKNCNFDNFATAISIEAEPDNQNCEIKDLVIHNVSVTNSIRGVLIGAWDNGVPLSTVDNVIINNSNFSVSSQALWLSASGSGVVSNIDASLNNIFSGVMENDGATNLNFCHEQSDGILRGNYGNYFDSSIVHADRIYDGCDNNTDMTALKSEFRGKLPLFCGVELLDSITLTENLKNSTGGTICPGKGLYVGSADKSITCEPGVLINGSGTNSGFDVYGADRLTISGCNISNFNNAVGLYLADDVTISDNFMYSDVTTSKGVQIWDSPGAIIDGNVFMNLTDAIRFLYSNTYLTGVEIFNNSFKNSTNYDIITSGSGSSADIYNNTFTQGISDILNIGNFCYNNIGNTYHINNTNLPPSYDCGSAYVNWSSPSNDHIVDISNLILTDNITCAGSTDCLTVAHDNVTIDCQGNTINGTTITDQHGISTSFNYTTVSNCNISGFDVGALFNTSSGNGTIFNNSFQGSTFGSLNISSNYSNISKNAFMNGTIEGPDTTNNFCVNNIGNFYPYDVTPATGDCGTPTFNDTHEALTNASTFTSRYDPVSIYFKQQDSPITVNYTMYYYDFYDDTPGWELAGYSTDVPYPFLMSSTATISWENLTQRDFRFNITPFVLGTQGHSNITENFTIYRGDSDLDEDGFKRIIGNDCNDDDPNINPAATEQCIWEYRSTDFNCNDQSRWGDEDCGAVVDGVFFNPGDFTDPGSIPWDDINASDPPNKNLNDYADLYLNNTWGEINFTDNIILNGTDLRLVTIEHNHIAIDDSVTHLTNKAATLTFYNTGFEQKPVVYRNSALCGNDCSNSVWDEATHQMRFQVSGFSSYNLSNNSQINIYSQADLGQPTETYNRITFYANYTKVEDNVSINNYNGSGDPKYINNGSCNLSIFDWNNIMRTNITMEYLSYEGIYKGVIMAKNFSAVGDYTYHIFCNSTKYENATAQDVITVTQDTTPPDAPTLYPQTLLHTTNYTDDGNTTVAGYFGEPDLNVTIVVLQGGYYHVFNTTSRFSSYDSEFKGSSPTLSFDSYAGQNQTFVTFSENNLSIFSTYKYVEFSGHNRSLFKRYEIVNATRTGPDILLEFSEPLEQNVFQANDTVKLYNTEYPPGYFEKEVKLFLAGANRITAWGEDMSGNSGAASIDWINALASDPAPAPIIWSYPEAVNDGFDLIGILNEPALNYTDLELVNSQYPNITVNESDPSVYRRNTRNLTRYPSQPRSVNDTFVYISDADYAQLTPEQWNDTYVKFSNHNLTYWRYYNVTDSVNHAGEDARLYISPALQHDINESVLMEFFNEEYPNGWFNVTVNESTGMTNGTNVVFLFGIKNTTGTDVEGQHSTYMNITWDIVPPEASMEQRVYLTNTPTIKFNLSDNYKINLSSLWINMTNISESDTNHTYYFNYSHPSFSCANFSNNATFLCNLTLNYTNGSVYNFSIYVEDLAGNPINMTENTSWFQIETLEANISIDKVYDYRDISQHNWLNFSWDYSPKEDLDHFEYALGTAPWPDADFDSLRNWTNLNETDVGNATNNSLFLYHVNKDIIKNASTLTLWSGTIYYLSVRAQDTSGDYGIIGTSDGVLFFDTSAPDFHGIDTREYTNSHDTLYASWNFTDNQSDVLYYMYTIGNDTYPNPGYDSLVGRTITDKPYTNLHNNLPLVHDEVYYFNVKAMNGNLLEDFNGTWSGWKSTGGTTVDWQEPSGGSIWYNNTAFTSPAYIDYNTGTDNSGSIDKAYIVAGSSQLHGGACDPIMGFDAANYSIADGHSHFNFPVENNTCYVFALDVYDFAGNFKRYLLTNETLRIYKADEEPPTTISSVTDEGFYTFDKNQLSASWTPSSDSGSGLDVYEWRIYRDNAALEHDCNITDQPEYPYFNSYADIEEVCPLTMLYGTSAGNVTNPSLQLSGLNLTHNYKYYFAITPWDKGHNNGTTTVSDGIVYIDNAAPNPLHIHMVNEDNESSSPYLTRETSGNMNITLFGDIDGGHDIANCVLMTADLDYTEDNSAASVLNNCTLSRVDSADNNFSLSLTNNISKNITRVECLNNTKDAYNEAEPIELTDTWYVSCRDFYWNTQTYNQNTPVWFTVDWYSAPDVSVDLDFENPGMSYTDQNIYCNATVVDDDGDFNYSDVNISWFRDGEYTFSDPAFNATGTAIAYEGSNGDTHNYSSIFSSEYTYRGANITCQVFAIDNQSMPSITNTSVTVLNSPPSAHIILDDPDDTNHNNNVTFSWFEQDGHVLDYDADYLTYTIKVDNETDFNVSNNPSLSFYPVEPVITVGEVQRNPSVYQDRIVYEDNRSGNWNIFMYDLDTGVETAVGITSANDTRPFIYGNYIYYQQGGNSVRAIKKYDINTAVTTNFATDAQADTLYYFGGRLVYRYGNNTIRYFDLVNSEAINISTTVIPSNLTVYGDLVAYDNGTDVYVYDTVSKVKNNFSEGVGPSMSGKYLTFYNTSSLKADVYYLNNLSLLIDRSYEIPKLYGAMWVGTSSNGHDLVVYDLEDPGFISALNVDPESIAIYDDLIAFGNGTDILIMRENRSYPNQWTIEDPDPSLAHLASVLDAEDGKYYWGLEVCDSAFECVNATAYGLPIEYKTFTVDKTPPDFISTLPTNNSFVYGEFKLLASLHDNLEPVATRVEYVNYTLYNDSGEIVSQGDMIRTGATTNTWASAYKINFTPFTNINFSILYYANDSAGNWQTYISNFTSTNETPWFSFGNLEEDGVIAGNKIYENFTAFNVLDSTFKIIGPYPSQTVRFIQAQTDTVVVNHVYNDSIPISTWQDGFYTIVFTGDNGPLRPEQNRSFKIDRQPPVYSNPYPNSTHLGTVFAADYINLSINWSDLTLVQVNITYNNSDASLPDLNEIFDPSDEFKVGPIPVVAYINRSYNWSSTAVDGFGRPSNFTGGVFVMDNPPVNISTPANFSILEDRSTSNPSELSNLDLYFSDPNDGAYDDLTFNFTSNCSTNLTMTIDDNVVTTITTHNNYTGECLVQLNATDEYDETAQATNFTITVNNTNDAPYFTVPPGYAQWNVSEDNATGLIIDMSSYAHDIDPGDSITWQSVDVQPTGMGVYIIDQTPAFKDDNGYYNFTLLENRYGVFNITFAIMDAESIQSLINITVNVTSVEDYPTQPNFTNSTTGGVSPTTPDIGSTTGRTFWLSWNTSSDGDLDPISYGLYYRNASTSDPWEQIALVTDGTKTSYQWVSSDNISNTRDIELNITAYSTTYQNSSVYSDFTVDNYAPEITIFSPTVVTVDSVPFTVEVGTHENATCTYAINGTGTFSNQEDNIIQHNATLDGIAYNTTYNFTVTCKDPENNTNSKSLLFELRQNPIEFIRAFADPAWVYEESSINITLEVASNDTIDTILIDVVYPDGVTTDGLLIGDFAPELNNSNKLTYYYSVPTPTPVVGKYNLSIRNFASPSEDITYSPPILVEDVFEVFQKVNQTLYVEE